MNNACPQCDTAYGVSAAHVGRQFKCKKCGAALEVAASGLVVQGGSAAAPVSSARSVAKSQASKTHKADRDADHESDSEEEEIRAPRSKKHTRNGGNVFLDYLFFRRMTIPLCAQIVFWFLALICMRYGIELVIDSFDVPAVPQQFGRGGLKQESVGGGFSGRLLFVGLSLTIIGPMFCRVVCEIAILILSINNTLLAMKDKDRH